MNRYAPQVFKKNPDNLYSDMITEFTETLNYMISQDFFFPIELSSVTYLG